MHSSVLSASQDKRLTKAYEIRMATLAADVVHCFHFPHNELLLISGEVLVFHVFCNVIFV